MTPEVNMSVSVADAGYIKDIAQRVVDWGDANMRGHRMKMLDVIMDLTAVHANGCPLYLATLAQGARISDVMHDVVGISRHLDRKTGKLQDGFLPRYAIPEKRPSRKVEPEPEKKRADDDDAPISPLAMASLLTDSEPASSPEPSPEPFTPGGGDSGGAGATGSWDGGGGSDAGAGGSNDT